MGVGALLGGQSLDRKVMWRTIETGVAVSMAEPLSDEEMEAIDSENRVDYV
jgi:hypothetical protein